MNIPETVSFDKEGHIERFPLFRKLFLALIILLVASLSFGIGRLSVVGNREPITIEYDTELATGNIAPSVNKEQTAAVINTPAGKPALPSLSGTSVVTSKNGSKYHYAYCPGAKQIKEANKVIFASPAAAEAAGYTLAANCKPK